MVCTSTTHDTFCPNATPPVAHPKYPKPVHRCHSAAQHAPGAAPKPHKGGKPGKPAHDRSSSPPFQATSPFEPGDDPAALDALETTQPTPKHRVVMSLSSSASPSPRQHPKTAPLPPPTSPALPSPKQTTPPILVAQPLDDSTPPTASPPDNTHTISRLSTSTAIIHTKAGGLRRRRSNSTFNDLGMATELMGSPRHHPEADIDVVTLSDASHASRRPSRSGTMRLRRNVRQYDGIDMASVSRVDELSLSPRLDTTTRTLLTANRLLFAFPSEPLYATNTLPKPNKLFLNNRELVFSLCTKDLFRLEKTTVDVWSSLRLPQERWVSAQTVSRPLVPIETLTAMNVEFGPNSVTNETDLGEYETIRADDAFNFYETFFFGNKSVKHLLGLRSRAIVSCQKVHTLTRCIVWKAGRITRALVPPRFDFAAWADVFSRDDKLLSVGNKHEIDRRLLELERLSAATTFKVGVLYAGPHQRDEQALYENTHVPTTFYDFLRLFAAEVPLQNWPRYRGELDTKDNLHGPVSYYATLNGREVMFHVGPLLKPQSPNIFLDRKRLIGNDLVVVVFKEPANADDLVDPLLFESQMNSRRAPPV